MDPVFLCDNFCIAEPFLLAFAFKPCENNLSESDRCSYIIYIIQGPVKYKQVGQKLCKSK